ncbi:hypothetical protein ACU4GD_44020 [Cupriavidus basilensis]
MKYPLAGLALASLLLDFALGGRRAKDGAADKLAPMLESLGDRQPAAHAARLRRQAHPDGRDVTALCVEVRGDGVMRQVGVPRDKRPAFMDGPHVVAFVDRNALVGLIVPTDGVRSGVVGGGKPDRALRQALPLGTGGNEGQGRPARQEHACRLDEEAADRGALRHSGGSQQRHHRNAAAPGPRADGRPGQGHGATAQSQCRFGSAGGAGE